VHLKSDHANHDRMISENQLTNAGESTFTNPNRCCPVCLLIIETIDILHSHIALHLERFAIFSLPRSIDETNEDEDHGSANADLDADGSRDDDFDFDEDFRLGSEISHSDARGYRNGDKESDEGLFEDFESVEEAREKLVLKKKRHLV